MTTLNPGLRDVLAGNTAAVRERIAASAKRSGRDAGNVRLVAVVKSIDAAVLPLFASLGIHDLAENRVQQLAARAQLRGFSLQQLDSSARAESDPSRDAPPCWHLIGHLQRNKVRQALRYSRIIHAVDSDRLAAEISAEATGGDFDVDCLLEVNVAGEENKYGIPPNDLDRIAIVVAGLPRIHWRGLMTMAPQTEEVESLRPVFAKLREMRDGLVRRGIFGAAFSELSMGMSQDFEVAIEEGATLIRVGTTLCAGLPPARD